MKSLLFIFALFVSFGAVAAAQDDADILKDACAAIKASVKRAECLAALSRIQTPPPAPALAVEPPKDLRPNDRGVRCESFEFAELDTLGRYDLESLICSYSLGVRISNNALEKQLATADDRVKPTLMTADLAIMRRCNQAQNKVSDLLRRKHPGAKADCKTMLDKVPEVPKTN